MENEQRLGEFVANILDDLQSGAVTAEEAIVASSQYEYVRSLFSQHAEELAGATATGDESLKISLISIFSQTKGRLAELPAFSSQTPDILRDEKQTRDTVVLERAAFETIRKETKTKASSRKITRQEFIHALVSKYSSTELKINTAVEGALKKSSDEQSLPEAQKRFSKEVSEGLGNVGNDFEKIIAESWRDSRIEKEALVTLFTHSDLSRPDVVADVFIHASDKENLSDVSAHATKLAQTAGAIANLGTKQPTIKGSFFSSTNTKGVIKGLQQAADGILSLVGEPLREIIIKEKINGVILSVLTNTSQLADKLGEQFIRSPIFGFVSQNILKNANEKPSMSQPTAVLSDVFSSIFQGPLNTATTRGAQNQVYDYLALARASSNAPKGFSFLGTNIMPWHLGAGLVENRKKSSTWFPSFGLHALQSLSSLAGNALATIFDRFVGFVFSGSSLSRQIHASRRAAAIPLPLSEDLPLLLAIVVVSTIVLLYVFPTFLNIPHLSMTQKMSALLASLNQKEGAQGPGEGSVVDCTKTPSDKLCSFKSCPDCKWPTNGYITQGPQVTCDKKFSHADGNDANGVDIATLGSPDTPVYSIREGVVVTFNNTCGVGGLGNTCGGSGYGGYGNYVVIRSTDGYTMMFAHLKKTINPAIKSGASVAPGTQIGWMDNSGNTSGQHLHFGVLSGQSVLDLLPDQPNKKSDILGCVNRSLLCFVAGKICPMNPVSAQ